MTSVLYSAGLNYQLGNPVRSELANLRTTVTEVRKLVEGYQTDINNLKNDMKSLTKNIVGNRSAIATLTTQVNYLLNALNAVGSQGNFTFPQAPTQSTASTSVQAQSQVNAAAQNVVDDDDNYDDEEEAPAPAPVPKPRRRRVE
jgi:septal ring factor EnvC (AmiA/AmiB activator)